MLYRVQNHRVQNHRVQNHRVQNVGTATTPTKCRYGVKSDVKKLYVIAIPTLSSKLSFDDVGLYISVDNVDNVDI